MKYGVKDGDKVNDSKFAGIFNVSIDCLKIFELSRNVRFVLPQSNLSVLGG